MGLKYLLTLICFIGIVGNLCSAIPVQDEVRAPVSLVYNRGSAEFFYLHGSTAVDNIAQPDTYDITSEGGTMVSIKITGVLLWWKVDNTGLLTTTSIPSERTMLRRENNPSGFNLYVGLDPLVTPDQSPNFSFFRQSKYPDQQPANFYAF